MKFNYIVLIGPDGCGKTSVALGLKSKLNSLGYEVEIYEFSFGIMPAISKILKLKKNFVNTSPNNYVGMVNPISSFRAILLSIWYGFDHLCGYFKLNKKKRKIIIFARSYHDFFYQRIYNDLPLFFSKIFYNLRS